MDLTYKFTNLISTIGLPTTLIYEISSDKYNINDEYLEIRKLSKTILSIASIQYSLTYNINDINKIEIYRYIDWLFTTPLLLKMYFLYAKINGLNNDNIYDRLFTFNIIMIITGYIYNITNNKIYQYISFSSFFVILYYIRFIENYLSSINIDSRNITIFFYVGWTIYGIASLFPLNIKLNLYNISDFINKSIFSIVFNNFIENNK